MAIVRFINKSIVQFVTPEERIEMTLVIKPIEAMLTKDLDTFSKMDPYAVIKIGAQKQRTKAHNGGGKKPKWMETFQFMANGQDRIMSVEVWDKDTFSDDLVGEGSLNLSQLYQNPSRTENEYIDLINKGKSAGRILISCEYQGPSMGGNNNMGGGNNWGNSNWGNGPNSGWNNGPNSGWGIGPNNNGWNNGPNNGGWNNGPNNGGWGNNGPNNGGWGNNGPNNGGWNNGPNNGGWGNNNGPNSGWNNGPNNGPNSGWNNGPNNGPNNGWNNGPNNGPNSGWNNGPNNGGWGNNNGWNNKGW